MSQDTRNTVVGIVVILVIGLILFFHFRPSGSPHVTSGTAASNQQASSTISQALRMAHWIAKEYPAQKN